ncbi:MULTISPECIES: hypothetical protein [Moorena]|uniref:Uncharacterized protein n=1 Tax=Moorena producens 3L TaxID=489825 RepID=F4XR71_9CYAN|nr:MULTISPECIES: hypothetical protein [Moorena]EGJ33046.1 hypothetical protein LYNGBM3L_55910 [Moorena producens 3L]NEP67989.1 hypothetical protein [Moorena sp. SIO3A5]NES43689.1 hypothetical protein [Moorena sp. SIO2C4]OLT64578.1 hypothetical protein BI334_05650 [Moorena producens 3L]
MTIPVPPRTRAQESRAAIERIYVIMRHLFIRGYYKPGGASGAALRQALLTLQPEIYGSIADPQKVELNGLVYVIDRLPCGMEMCRFVKLVAAEGYSQSGFETIVPAKRRRNCYRIDQETMLIEITRGRSEIYDILTHLTFIYIEANKIRDHALEEGQPTREWIKLEEMVTGQQSPDNPKSLVSEDLEVQHRAFSYLSTLLGRTFEETKHAYHRLAQASSDNNGLFDIIYWLGRVAMEEVQSQRDRKITFSSTLRERIGHHIHGAQWATDIKSFLLENNLWERPLHIISANLHSVMNCLFAPSALKPTLGQDKKIEEIARELSLPENAHLNQEVREFALQNGMFYLADRAGTNIHVQIFDTAMLPLPLLSPELPINPNIIEQEKPVILVMDYAFGEQAFEIMDELLKPYKTSGHSKKLNVKSISVMGKAGILVGQKGDLMLPTAHIFEGTADNYPFVNELKSEDFKDDGIPIYEGALVTVMGTSLQNSDILAYFKSSSWNVIGLEMEGAHLQKAIQAASMIRKSIDDKVKLRYAYYASDNPLLTGSTLASGGLGTTGVKPTYLITMKFLQKILA